MPAYEAVIGLEVHVQARTKSKMFCSCPNQFGAEPNTLVCPVCMGYPGVLPTPNKEAIRKIVTAGLMCSCDIQKRSKFDRKSYFYPDMPKNYQLTQYDMPFCLNGRIHIYGKGFSGEELPDKYIRLTRIHMEEDVAKLTHFGTHSGVDFNRAGVPLMEIVSEPDMRSPDEAYAYLTSLKQIIQYADISDCDMEKGQMRCDVNISIRERGAEAFGTKVELKNLNSFRAVHRAIAYEIKRQIVVLTEGGMIEQETRGWNDDAGESYTMRGKEKRGSLLWVLDKTKTAMGGRLLRAWMERPLLSPAQITRRLTAVEELVKKTIDREELILSLREITDFERAMTRIMTGTASCRDLAALSQGAASLPAVKERLSGMRAPYLQTLFEQLDTLADLKEKIDAQNSQG